NAAYFFREFTFSKNTFKPNPKDELELADTVVWLDDFLIVSQLKERNAPAGTTAEKEEAWYKEMRKRATEQIRNTLTYLKTYPSIEVVNNRGHAFDIASAHFTQIHKLIIYSPHELLPIQYSQKKFYISKTAGLIHLLHAAAYHEILRLLITPTEIGE